LEGLADVYVICCVKACGFHLHRAADSKIHLSCISSTAIGVWHKAGVLNPG